MRISKLALVAAAMTVGVCQARERTGEAHVVEDQKHGHVDSTNGAKDQMKVPVHSSDDNGKIYVEVPSGQKDKAHSDNNEAVMERPDVQVAKTGSDQAGVESDTMPELEDVPEEIHPSRMTWKDEKDVPRHVGVTDESLRLASRQDFDEIDCILIPKSEPCPNHEVDAEGNLLGGYGKLTVEKIATYIVYADKKEKVKNPATMGEATAHAKTFIEESDDNNDGHIEWKEYFSVVLQQMEAMRNENANRPVAMHSGEDDDDFGDFGDFDFDDFDGAQFGDFDGEFYDDEEL